MQTHEGCNAHPSTAIPSSATRTSGSRTRARTKLSGPGTKQIFPAQQATPANIPDPLQMQVPVHIPDLTQPQNPPAQPPSPPVNVINQMLQLNWSYFKPEFSGKPEEDAEAHLMRTNDWMETHNFQR